MTGKFHAPERVRDQFEDQGPELAANGKGEMFGLKELPAEVIDYVMVGILVSIVLDRVHYVSARQVSIKATRYHRLHDQPGEATVASMPIRFLSLSSPNRHRTAIARPSPSATTVAALNTSLHLLQLHFQVLDATGKQLARSETNEPIQAYAA